MTDDRGIGMSEFKTVVEAFRSDVQKIVENMNYRFNKSDNEQVLMKEQMSSIKEQIGLMLIGQTEIKSELRSNRQEFETRMVEVEKKVGLRK